MADQDPLVGSNAGFQIVADTPEATELKLSDWQGQIVNGKCFDVEAAGGGPLPRVTVDDEDHQILATTHLVSLIAITADRTVWFPKAADVAAGAPLYLKAETPDLSNQQNWQLRPEPTSSDTIEGIGGFDWIAGRLFAGYYSDGVSGWWRIS